MDPLKIAVFGLLTIISIYSTVNARYTGKEINELARELADVMLEEAELKRHENAKKALLEKRIVNGREAKRPWPFLVSMRQKMKIFGLTLDTHHFCGASLLNSRWLLTAAHCFPNATEDQAYLDQFEARLGDKDLKSNLEEDVMNLVGEILKAIGEEYAEDELTKEDIAEIKDWIDWVVDFEKVIIHPEYDDNDAFHGGKDIALVKLARDVPAAPNVVSRIQSVKLPKQDSGETLQWPEDNVNCTLKGWGCTELGGDEESPSVVHVANLTKVPDEDCSRFINMSMASRLCAGPMPENLEILSEIEDVDDLYGIKFDLSGASGCPGDSGGPLMAWQDGELVQAGVTSWIFNIKGLSHAFPSVFTRVSYYVNWIETTMANN